MISRVGTPQNEPQVAVFLIQSVAVNCQACILALLETLKALTRIQIKVD